MNVLALMYTGRHAMRSGVFTTIAGRSIMHRRDTTLPDILRDNGYHTAIFGKWHLGFSYPYRPQDRGFDEVFVEISVLTTVDFRWRSDRWSPTSPVPIASRPTRQYTPRWQPQTKTRQSREPFLASNGSRPLGSA